MGARAAEIRLCLESVVAPDFHFPCYTCACLSKIKWLRGASESEPHACRLLTLQGVILMGARATEIRLCSGLPFPLLHVRVFKQDQMAAGSERV